MQLHVKSCQLIQSCKCIGVHADFLYQTVSCRHRGPAWSHWHTMQHQMPIQSVREETFSQGVQTFTNNCQAVVLKGIAFEFVPSRQVIAMQPAEPTVYTSPRSRHGHAQPSSELAICALKAILHKHCPDFYIDSGMASARGTAGD